MIILKKILAFVLVLLLLSGCGTEAGSNIEQNSENPVSSETPSEETPSEETSSEIPEEKPLPKDLENPSYTALINELTYTGSYYAEAFIGYIEGPMGTGYEEFYDERGYLEDYSFLADIPYERYVETDGSEMYCVVPKDLDTKVLVEEWIYEENGNWKAGKVLYQSDSGEPIVITCNFHDYIPNTRVTLEFSDGKKAVFVPDLDLEDTWLSLYNEEGVVGYDFSIYDYPRAGEVMSFKHLLGDWTAWYSPYGNYTLQLHLNIYEGAAGEKCVTYWYGEEEGEMLRYYEGYLFDELYEDGTKGSNLIFDGTLTQGTESAEVGPINYRIMLEFRMSDYNTDCMIVSRFGGDHFIAGEEYIGFLEFTRAYG